MLKVDLCGVELKNPLIMASGTFGFAKEFTPYVDISELGAVVSKGLTLYSKEGNHGIRMWETPSGMLNSVGLQNPGVEGFINNELPIMERLGSKIIVNLGGDDLEQYVKGAQLLANQDSVEIIELNISCPNVKSGGMAFGMNPSSARQVVKEVKAVTNKPLMVKLSPNAPDIVAVAIACQEAGADALSLINTVKGMVIDIYNRKPMFNNIYAGLSGPAVMPIALRMVYEVYKEVTIPIVGLGGINSGEDVVQYIMAGAKAVQIGTANLMNPTSSIRILNELRSFMERTNIKSLAEIYGVAHN